MLLYPLEPKKPKTNAFYKFMFSPFYSAMRLYVKADIGAHYQPIVHGSSLTDEEREEIFQFRNDCYRGKNDYLIPSTQEDIEKEKKFDRMAFHALVRNGQGQLLGVSRYLPYPFEMSAIGIPEDLRLSQFMNYLEISRLVVANPGKGTGRRLLIHSGLWAIEDTIYDGFLAICREKNLKLFSYFGLSTLAQFNLEVRKGSTYSLIKADFRLISKSTLKLFTVQKNPLAQLALSLKTWSLSKRLTRS